MAFRESQGSYGLPVATISSFLDYHVRPELVLRQLITGKDKRGQSVLLGAGADDLLSANFVEPAALSESSRIIRDDVISHLTTTWARGQDQRFVVIHAPAGFGKSMFSHQLAKRLAESYKLFDEWSKPPLPFLMAFGNFRRGSSNFDGLIMERLQQDGPPLVTGKAFRELIAHRRINLILDGFDEMIEANAEVARSNIQNFVTSAGSQARIILTSRSTFFKTRSDVEDQMNSLGLGLDEIEVLELQGFTNEQVSKYVHRAIRNTASAEKIVRRVLDDSKIGEISRTPLILREIVELEREDRMSSASLSRRNILDVLVDKTLQREISRKELELSIKEQTTFLKELAFELLLRETPDIDQDDLALLAQICLPELSESEQLDSTVAKLGNHFYLINSPGGGRFVSMHTVWREFFQARALAAKLIEKPPKLTDLTKVFSTRLLPTPLLAIVGGLIDPSIIVNLVTSSNPKGLNPTTTNFLNNLIRLALACKLDDGRFKGLIGNFGGLSGKNLVDLQFENRDLRTVSFSSSQLKDCRFVNCDLRNVDFSGSLLDGVILRDCKYDSGLRFASPTRLQIDDRDLSHPELLQEHIKALNPDINQPDDSSDSNGNEGHTLEELLRSRLELFTNAFAPGTRPTLRRIAETALTRGVDKRYTTSIRRHVVPALTRSGIIEKSKGRASYIVCDGARHEVVEYLARGEIGVRIQRALTLLSRENR
jgi:hypothetical protein